jgi:hypothetical protein
MDSMIVSSKETCSRKPSSPRASKWFNKDIRKALTRMRKDRARSRIVKTNHNILSYQTSRANYLFQIKRAKRSYTLYIASKVKPSTNLWKLNSWYRGIRRSVTPSLKRPDNSWASSSPEKVDLLHDTWFPPPAQVAPFPHLIVEQAHSIIYILHSILILPLY